MAPKNRNKFGLSIPIDPRWKAFDGFNTATIPPPSSHTARSPRPPISPRPIPPPPTLERSETEELQRLEHAPPFWKSNNKKLSKQLSLQETSSRRDIAWEKRRKEIFRQEKRRKSLATIPAVDGENLTDGDLYELRGSIELGFGFNEEGGGHKLCDTLPALDLYFAVKRQLSLSPTSLSLTPQSALSPSSSLGSPRSEDSWRICSPRDSTKQVKAKLRHWAQAVACSVMMQSP